MSISSRIERVRAEDLLDEPAPTKRAPGRGLSRRRRLSGLALGLLGLPLVTLALDSAGDSVRSRAWCCCTCWGWWPSPLVGGMAVALLAAVASALLINFYFVEPLHTLDIAQARPSLALGVFVVVAADRQRRRRDGRASSPRGRAGRRPSRDAVRAGRLRPRRGRDAQGPPQARAQDVRHGVGRAQGARSRDGQLERRRVRRLGAQGSGGAPLLRSGDQPEPAAGGARPCAVCRGRTRAAGVRRGGRDRL